MRRVTEIENTDIFWKHVDTIHRVSDELLEAEETIRRIRSSKEFKDAYNYFSVKKNRGFIIECPRSENGYRVKLLSGKFV